MEAVLADDPLGRWFRENVELMVIPFMDKDGVEDGDQGKNRQPHDHNRDYLDESIYASVAALRKRVPEWSAGRLRIALDMHCPTLGGGGNEQLVFVGQPDPGQWAQLQEFSRLLERYQQGPLMHQGKHNLPWGQGWNNLKEPKTFSSWASQLPGVRFAATIEIPYANAGGQAVTADSARALGHDLALSMQHFLQQDEHKHK